MLRKNKMKITVSSGGHSSVIMRVFPYIKRDKLLVINMQKFKGVEIKKKNLIINSVQ
jgi:hypothetical protein